ncbi:MAG: GNAT family N-acetyltransferase [Thermomonas sp.]|uniref:GNAT family N-acetyltransferase n=1 Tax=Thermomonas sp. TaxID=1971895 RepID=UPI0039E560AB
MSEIRHDAAHHRFVTIVDGHTARIDYVSGDSAIAITHTIVPPEIGGRGIAGELMRAVALHARNEGLRIDPQCSYADAWLRRHPEFDGLRA